MDTKIFNGVSEKIKNYVGIAVIISLLLVGASAWSYAVSYSKQIQPGSFRNFSVSGEGKVVAVPDIAQFTFSVITEGGKNVADLQKQNTEKVNKAIEFVKKNGVGAKDVKTQQYSIEPKYQYHSCPRDGGVCPPPSIVGYTVRQTVLVKARDFGKIGDLLSGVVQNGANSVSELQFTIDDPTEVQNEARAEAIKKAKEKAELIAEAGGFSLGQLLAIDESGAPYLMYERYSAMKTMGIGGGMDEAPSPTIEPGSQDVTISVTLRYEIK